MKLTMKKSEKNDALNNIPKSPNRIIILHLNNNLIRNKSELLKDEIGNKIDILFTFERKLDGNSF